MTAIRRRSSGLALIALLAACSSNPQHVAELSPGQSEGTFTILQAAQEAGAGRYGVADKLLFDYSARYPMSSEAADALYWRALYKLDPANPNATPHDAVMLLDSYMSAGAGTHRIEATTLRRLATAMDVRPGAVATLGPIKLELPKPEDKAKDEELQRVREELAKANAEIERIKRRLAQPKP